MKLTSQFTESLLKTKFGDSMVDSIEIDDKKYSKRTLELLSGVKNYYELDTELLVIAEAIDNPYDFPFLVEDIYDLDFDEDMRLALIRVQIDSKLNLHKDLEREQLRLYVAETIEKMMFGELLMEGDGKGKEMDNDKSKKSKGKGKGASKGKGKGGGRAKGKGKGGGRGKGRSKGKGKQKKGENETDDDWGKSYI